MNLEEWKTELEEAILVKLAELDSSKTLKILDVGVFPWHTSIELSAFYVGDDSDDVSEDCIASWPNYNFSHQEDGKWPEVNNLCETMNVEYQEVDKVNTSESEAIPSKLYFQAAADVMKRYTIAKALNEKQLDENFRITVLDPDDPEKDYM